ncbi:transferrin-binding protein-like solute binding protein [Ursidibacter arcticus]
MNKNTFVKFSLTLISAAVLAACGSSGGKGGAEAPKGPSQEELEQQRLEAERIRLENERKAKIAAIPASFGHQFTQKNNSNLNVGFGTETSSKSSDVKASTYALDASLDTIVIGVEDLKDGKRKLVYLEDFDFRGNTDNTVGQHTLAHIHQVADGKTVALNTARTGGKSRTKTEFKGDQTGTALVLQKDRQVYLAAGAKGTAGVTIANNGTLRNLKDTVAEVYGNRTFLAGDSEQAQGVAEGLAKNAALENAPFLTEDKKAGTLNFVQYGRVTSKLDKIKIADVRPGLNIDGFETHIASYGKYGEEGTENHYFYRSNSAARGNVDAKALIEKTYKDGTVKYNGHAVTYGLDHSLTNRATGVPNAVGYHKELVSGTHVEATLDLNKQTVVGSLYDVWTFGNGSVKPAEISNTLVDFRGDLNTNNGAILGTALHNGAQGTFQANLFDQVNELGGAVASTEKDAGKAWGAVFGAKAVVPSVTTPDDGISATNQSPAQ